MYIYIYIYIVCNVGEVKIKYVKTQYHLQTGILKYIATTNIQRSTICNCSF